MADLTCPKCESPMRSYERSGITVDQCTGCRGVFLDRGELERLVDAEGAFYGEKRDEEPFFEHRRRDDDDDYDRERRGFGGLGGLGGHGKRKREGFLGEMFDFD